jgi:hypothetical protein
VGGLRFRTCFATKLYQRDWPLRSNFGDDADRLLLAPDQPFNLFQSGRSKNLSCPASTPSSAKAASDLYRADHWITSSARRSSDGGIVIPSAFAVFRLMTSSNLVGCSTGSTPGLTPLRILIRGGAPPLLGEVRPVGDQAASVHVLSFVNRWTREFKQVGWLMGFEPTTTGITIRETRYADQSFSMRKF